MKKYLLSFLSLFFISSSFISVSFGQDEDPQNIIALEFYLPIVPRDFSSMYNFYGNQNPISLSDEMTTRLHASIGLGYERLSARGFLIRARFGFSHFMERTTGSRLGLSFLDFSDAKYVEGYSQKAQNIILGLGHRIPVRGGFVIDAGIHLGFFHYGKRNAYFISDVTQFSLTSGTQNRTYSTGETQMNGSYSIGNGIFIKPEYQFNNHLVLSLEMQFFYMFTKANIFRETAYFESQGSGTLNAAPVNYVESQSYSSSLYMQKKWDWSNWSPLLRMGYRF